MDPPMPNCEDNAILLPLVRLGAGIVGTEAGHLGDLGELPTQSEIEELNIGDVDVLLVPVGGGETLDPTRAVEVIGLFEPKVVIPMHYRHPGLSSQLN
ncbi:MAG TPA: MBL fold metallo-hydrolase, partial [Caldilineaceae bacterium]|nr:MBL fold metallo-hydrolase [Caldilineaceae bacterium]